MKKVLLIVVTIIFLGGGGYLIYGKVKVPKSETAASLVLENKKETKRIKPDEVVPLEVTIPIDKVWEFSFDKELDATTITKENIFIKGEQTENVDISVEVINGNKTIKILPPSDKYNKGEYYELHILNSVKYKDGNSVSSSYQLDFVTEKDEVEIVELNPNLIEVDKKEVKETTNNSIEIAKKVKKDDLKIGDILIIPSDKEPEGRAIKVGKIEKKMNSYVIEPEVPEFAELFERLELYKEFEVNEDNMETYKGIMASDFASIEPPTQVASSNSIPKKEGEYKKPSVDAKYEGGGVEVKLNNLELKNNTGEYFLSGGIKLYKPKVLTDIELGFMEIDRIQLSNKIKVASNLKIRREFSKEGSGIIKKEEKEGKSKAKSKKYQDKLPLAKITIPTSVPAVTIEGQIFLKVTYQLNGEISAEVVFEFEEEKGVYHSGKNTTLINHNKPGLSISLEGNGKGEVQGGIGISAAIKAFSIVGAGVEGFGGFEMEGEAAFGDSEKTDGPYACAKGGFGPFVQGSVFVDVLNIIEGEENRILEYVFAKESNRIGEWSNCEILTSIVSDNKKVELEAGEELELALNGRYINLLSMKNSNKSLDLKNAKISVKDDGLVDVRKQGKSIIIKALDSPKAENTMIDLSITYKTSFMEKEKEVSYSIPVIITNYKEIKERAKEEAEKEKLANKWNGEWNRNVKFNEGTITISNVTASSFDMDISVVNGANTGNATGTATINGNKATFKETYVGCTMDLVLSGNEIQVNQGEKCNTLGGNGTIFSGTYTKGPAQVAEISLSDRNMLTPEQDKEFRNLVGSDYKSFVDNMQLVSESTDTDGLNAKVFSGGVRGLYTIMEAIIMIDAQGNYYAATIKDGGEVVYYTTNVDYKDTLPATIEEWRSRFTDLPVVRN
jgi:hypothetical protein